VRKYARGYAVDIVKYFVNGKSKKRTLGPIVEGNLKAMRQVADEYLRDARAGKDRRAERKAAAEAAPRLKMLGKLVPTYLEVREKGDQFWAKMRPKTLRDVMRYLAKSWLPLHSTAVEQITRQMVKARRDEIADTSGAVSGNRAHAALGAFYAWAIDKNHRNGANPTADIKPLPESKRTRVLSETELAVIWQELGDGDFGRATKLLMLLGRRREEIGALEWAEYFPGKGPHGQLELPGHRVKNGQPHIIVPLSETA
jgi:integrase